MKRDPHRTSLPESLARYTAWLVTARRFSERTKREYRDDVSHLIEWLETRCHIESATSVQRQHLTGFRRLVSFLTSRSNVRTYAVAGRVYHGWAR